MKHINADRLRAEIARLIKAESIEIGRALKGGFNIDPCHEYALRLYNGILTYLDTLQEQPEADLEEEMVLYSEKHFDYNSEWDTLNPKAGGYFGPIEFDDIARHFYELGQKNAANKFDEIEYNRQRAEEETLGKTLDEAAEECENELLKINLNGNWSEDIHFAFKAGAKWMAGQGEVQEHFVIGHTEESQGHSVIVCYPESFGIGDKVIVQIRKKEESK